MMNTGVVSIAPLHSPSNRGVGPQRDSNCTRRCWRGRLGTRSVWRRPRSPQERRVVPLLCTQTVAANASARTLDQVVQLHQDLVFRVV